MGIRKEMAEKGLKIETDREGFMIGRIKMDGERWRIVEVYIREGMEKALKEMEQRTEDYEEGVRTIIGGDFNARTGDKGGRVRGDWEKEEEEEEEGRKRSKDKMINTEGRKLINFLEEKRWSILNGNTRRDEEGE